MDFKPRDCGGASLMQPSLDPMGIYSNIIIYLEPVSLSSILGRNNPPREGPNSNQNRGSFGFQEFISCWFQIFVMFSHLVGEDCLID